jgi:hypothetical protein
MNGIALRMTRTVSCLALVLAVCAACVGPARTADDRSGGGAGAVLGTWAGSSICVGDRPACKDEEVVYRFLAVEGQPQFVRLLADKIIDGKRVPMGDLQFRYDEADHSLTCEFTRGQTHGVWSFTVSGDTMSGTLAILPDKSVGRRVSVHRVRDDQVPPAPALEEYAALPRSTIGNISAVEA